ncbi:uncharacterized protein LOC134264343 isoform X1 [Saccostrea cucullata]|uniref:uncharacterized protein LOC134264343 isoform X1 n=1 Tax=Saccostrea cuccullata TaxID=36930 RepID=UPI002ED610A2
MSYDKVSSEGTTITKQPSATLNPGENGRNYMEHETGLESIENLDRIILSQEITACGLACPCCIGRGAYTVHDGNDSNEFLLEIREAFVCLFRSCLGSARDLTTRIKDSSGNDVGRFRRELSFRGCCICSCFLPQLMVFHPHSRIGTVRERRTCCRPSFEIVDRTEDVLFTFSNDCCYSQYCGWFMNVSVYVKDVEGEIVAKFIKKSYHNSEELIGLENKIHIEFLKKLKAQEKLLLIGAAMLLSLNNFEDTKRLCC